MPRRRNRRQPRQPIQVETFTHTDDTRVHIPSAEHESLMRDEETSPVWLAYQRRNRDLDPQLVW